MKIRLNEQMRAMDDAERAIGSKSRDSFSQWIYDIAHAVGYAAGSITGMIKRFLDAL